MSKVDDKEAVGTKELSLGLTVDAALADWVYHRNTKD